MKYKVQQITRDYHSFQDIEECTWDFTLSEVHTDKGTLKIIGFQEVEQNGQVGIQMNVNGYMEIGKYTSNSSQVAKIQTLAIMRRPHNVWLWVYLFNEFDQPIAAFCGTDGFDDNNSFAK